MSPIEALATLNLTPVPSAVRHGETFAAALEQMGGFDQADLDAIARGEQSGTLVQSLHLLADHHARIAQHRKKLRAALTYPLMVLILASILANVPALITGTSSLGRYLFQINLLPAALLGGGLLMRAVMSKPDHRRSILSALHHVPVLGPMLQQDRTWQFFSSARILVGAGLGVRTAFRELAASSADTRLMSAIQTWEENLEQGMPLSDALFAIEVFDPETRQLLSSAAQAGRLEGALETLTALHAIAMSSRVQLLYTLLPTISIFAVLLLILLGTAL